MCAVRNQLHIPVMVQTLVKNLDPVKGTWIDCTFGAGGYSRALIEAGAEQVFGIDRDPESLALTTEEDAGWKNRLRLFNSNFGEFDSIPGVAAALPVDGVVFDLGVSSMQLEQKERGFSFMKDGPLDMRMSGQGPTASDMVNLWSQSELADIFFHFGEEHAARRIARRIVEERRADPIVTTRQLARIIEDCVHAAGRKKIHPATKCFQALRITVNDELGQLARGLQAAERALTKGGRLAVVTFHSLEDRIVKRFMRLRSGQGSSANRHMPPNTAPEQGFRCVSRRALVPSEEEIARNPRSRSARLRIAIRTEVPACPVDTSDLGIPQFRTVNH